MNVGISCTLKVDSSCITNESNRYTNVMLSNGCSPIMDMNLLQHVLGYLVLHATEMWTQ